MCCMWRDQSGNDNRTIDAFVLSDHLLFLFCRTDASQSSTTPKDKTMDFAQEISQIAEYMILAPFGALGIAALLTVWFMVIVQSISR